MPDNSSLDCEWETATGFHVCRVCGWVYKNRDGSPRTPPVLPLHRPCPVKIRAASLWGIGDHVAMFLDAMGVTESRVAWLLVTLRIVTPLEGCGCERRKEVLNQWGWRVLESLKIRHWLK